VQDTGKTTSPEEQDRTAWLIFDWLCVLLCAAVVWGAHQGFYLRIPQIIFLLLLVGLPLFYLGAVIQYRLKLPRILEKQWPRPRFYPSRTLDKRSMEAASAKNSVLLGYENDGTPVLWSEEERAMQTNLPGKTGAGKTTLLLNLVEQDIKNGHPVVYFDGKGDKDLVLKIMDIAFAAGRGSDVRIIDPTHPEVSAKFNPFYAKDGQLQQRAGAIFESLGAAKAKDEFFAEHQRAFLNAVTVILEHTGQQFTFWDVLVACQQEETMNQIIEKYQAEVVNNPDLPQHKKNAFQLAISTLRGNYADKEWMTKIRGLLNSMMPFVGDTLSLITGSCSDLLTFEELVEKKQILIVTMNVGKDSHPYKALGRIMLRNLQFMIASRYDEYQMDKQYSFISVVLDEFGLYAYEGFKTIIHTARAANACIIFSFQNIKQLATEVGESFADDMANAPNNNFMMKSSEKDTASNFLESSAKVPTMHVNMRVERGGVFDPSPYVQDGTGSQQETMETQVKDYQVKLLPRGQMMALFNDNRIGVVVKHVHVRRAVDASFTETILWLPPLRTPSEDMNALNLTMDEQGPKPTKAKKGERNKGNGTSRSVGSGVNGFAGGARRR
jgi:type IV secretory pathway TraG/TraD family ATPase VirD4